MSNRACDKWEIIRASFLGFKRCGVGWGGQSVLKISKLSSLGESVSRGTDRAKRLFGFISPAAELLIMRNGLGSHPFPIQPLLKCRLFKSCLVKEAEKHLNLLTECCFKHRGSKIGGGFEIAQTSMVRGCPPCLLLHHSVSWQACVLGMHADRQTDRQLGGPMLAVLAFADMN